MEDKLILKKCFQSKFLDDLNYKVLFKKKISTWRDKKEKFKDKKLTTVNRFYEYSKKNRSNLLSKVKCVNPFKFSIACLFLSLNQYNIFPKRSGKKETNLNFFLEYKKKFEISFKIQEFVPSKKARILTWVIFCTVQSNFFLISQKYRLLEYFKRQYFEKNNLFSILENIIVFTSTENYKLLFLDRFQNYEDFFNYKLIINYSELMMTTFFLIHSKDFLFFRLLLFSQFSRINPWISLYEGLETKTYQLYQKINNNKQLNHIEEFLSGIKNIQNKLLEKLSILFKIKKYQNDSKKDSNVILKDTIYYLPWKKNIELFESKVLLVKKPFFIMFSWLSEKKNIKRNLDRLVFSEIRNFKIKTNWKSDIFMNILYKNSSYLPQDNEFFKLSKVIHQNLFYSSVLFDTFLLTYLKRFEHLIKTKGGEFIPGILYILFGFQICFNIRLFL